MFKNVIPGLCAFVLWSSCGGGAAQPMEQTRPLLVSVDTEVRVRGTTGPLVVPERSEVRFRVDKSDRIFEVYVADSLVKSYPCVLGEVPVGDKFHQGDRKTPEGTFWFRSKRVHPRWHKFIWVDYPNAESRRRYAARMAEGSIPAGKDIGGEIGIHGVPEGMDHWIDAGVDWTWGCIALRNADVDEIYPYIVPMRTEMEIVP